MSAGVITGISGPTVTVRMEGLRLYDRVHVGRAMLTGEIVRLGVGGAVVQVYEDTHGLGVGEPVHSSGAPLSVRLGPGLLGGMFDGLQRPLRRIMESTGAFITTGKDMLAIDHTSEWEFHPLKRPGDLVNPYEYIGYVDEGSIRHFVSERDGVGGRVDWIANGPTTMDDYVLRYEDGGGLFMCHEWPVRRPKPPGRRLAPYGVLLTGQRVLDFLIPMARGGAAVMPGGFGTGKTILQQSIAKYTDVDIVVYAGCGERGNEMADLIEELASIKDPRTGGDLMDRTVLVANTSNMPVAAREASIYTAVTMAEYYRDMGYSVLMLADSLSRWAEALREISTTLEEMPGEEGYPTYLASRLAGFFERAGAVDTMGGRRGSLSMLMSVSPPGADFTEPVTQACMRSCGAFVMLDTSLAHARQFPAINWSQSYSLYEREASEHAGEDVAGDWAGLRMRVIKLLKQEMELREITEVVGAEGLQDEDRLTMAVAGRIRAEFLAQNAFTDDAFSTLAETFKRISAIIDAHDRGRDALASGAPLAQALKEAAS